MDKRRFNGRHSKPGAGRKKGTGVSNKINTAVNNFMSELLEDEEIKSQVIKELKQISAFQGWIYIIKDNNTGYYKIGVTQKENPNTRLSLYRSHKMDIKIIFIDIVDGVFELEEILHGMFQRVSIGDWFELSDQNIIEIITKISNFKHPRIHLY